MEAISACYLLDSEDVQEVAAPYWTKTAGYNYSVPKKVLYIAANIQNRIGLRATKSREDFDSYLYY